MERKISFGKVDGYENGHKNCEVVAELKLENGCFSASCNLWNHIHTDIIMAGQCFDTLVKNFPELNNNEMFVEVLDLWEKYHLNDMHAGTPTQERLLKEAVASGELKAYGANNYDETCAYLESKGMLYDAGHMVIKTDKDGQEYTVPYKYGTGWLKEEIPEEDLERIESIVNFGVVLDRDEEMER